MHPIVTLYMFKKTYLKVASPLTVLSLKLGHNDFIADRTVLSLCKLVVEIKITADDVKVCKNSTLYSKLTSSLCAVFTGSWKNIHKDLFQAPLRIVLPFINLMTIKAVHELFEWIHLVC